MVYLYYLLNGFLALLWLLVDYILLALLIAPLAWLSYTAPDEQRPWTLVASGLAILASAATPSPVPLLMLMMAVAGWAATRLEQFNAAAARWNTVRGVALYGLAALAFTIYQDVAAHSTVSSLLMQGQVYLSAIAAFAMYLIPLGFLAILTQTLWAHPPARFALGALVHRLRYPPQPERVSWPQQVFYKKARHSAANPAILGYPDPRESARGLGVDGRLPDETGDDLSSEHNELLYRGQAKLREDFVFQVTARHIGRKLLTDTLVQVAEVVSTRT